MVNNMTTIICLAFFNSRGGGGGGKLDSIASRDAYPVAEPMTYVSIQVTVIASGPLHSPHLDVDVRYCLARMLRR